MTTAPDPGQSPFQQHLGIQPAQGWDITVVPREEHANFVGAVHGGFLMSVLDSVAGRASRMTLPEDKFAVTTSLTTSFVRGAEVGQELRASAQVRHLGRQLLTIEADVHRVQDGKLIAHGLATMTVLDRR